MVDIKQAADKLKKIVAGATIMAGIAMGTGCDNTEQIHRIPAEDIVNDDDENNINDENNPIENNDGDRPINNNDNDNPVEHGDNDTDEPIINDDTDNPIEHNDEDNNPDETDDNDTPSNECAEESIVLKAYQMEKMSAEDIQEETNFVHENIRSNCPYGSVIEKEKIDINGNMCIEDECHIGPNDIATMWDMVWIDNLPFLATNPSYSIPSSGDIVYFRKVEKLNN